MNKDKMKVSWTWEEWLANRAAVRAATRRITTSPLRRKESSSDNRLRKAFQGKRAP